MRMKITPEKVYYKFSQEGLNNPNKLNPQPRHRHFNRKTSSRGAILKIIGLMQYTIRETSLVR